VSDLFLDGRPEILESAVAEPVHVEEQVVEVEPLGLVGRTGRPCRLPWPGGRLGAMAFEGLGMMLVLGTVVLATVGAHERRVNVRHRVVCVFLGLLRGRESSRTGNP